MVYTMHNSTFHQSENPFEGTDKSRELFLNDKMLHLDFTEKYQDLQEKYSILYSTYAQELENSKKVKKSLGKCLKFYSKLCKKYEAQQKIIIDLEENIKQKMTCLEESIKNQEKMKGLIQIYKSERSLYSGESNHELKKDKEVLLDICCKLINESVKTNNIRNFSSLILRKFKKDLDDEKLNLLKGKSVTVKKEPNKIKESNFILMGKTVSLKNSVPSKNYCSQSGELYCDLKTNEKNHIDSQITDASPNSNVNTKENIFVTVEKNSKEEKGEEYKEQKKQEKNDLMLYDSPLIENDVDLMSENESFQCVTFNKTSFSNNNPELELNENLGSTHTFDSNRWSNEVISANLDINMKGCKHFSKLIEKSDLENVRSNKSDVLFRSKHERSNQVSVKIKESLSVQNSLNYENGVDVVNTEKNIKLTSGQEPSHALRYEIQGVGDITFQENEEFLGNDCESEKVTQISNNVNDDNYEVDLFKVEKAASNSSLKNKSDTLINCKIRNTLKHDEIGPKKLESNSTKNAVRNSECIYNISKVCESEPSIFDIPLLSEKNCNSNICSELETFNLSANIRQQDGKKVASFYRNESHEGCNALMIESEIDSIRFSKEIFNDSVIKKNTSSDGTKEESPKSIPSLQESNTDDKLEEVELEKLNMENYSTYLSDEELSKIFIEMTSLVRLVSPIKEVDCELKKENILKNTGPCLESTTTSSKINRFESVTAELLKTERNDSVEIGKKRNFTLSMECCEVSDKSKKLKSTTSEENHLPKATEENHLTKPMEEKNNVGLLDAIMSAMSLQTKEFKQNIISKVLPEKEEYNSTPCKIKPYISDENTSLKSKTEIYGSVANLSKDFFNENSSEQTSSHAKKARSVSPTQKSKDNSATQEKIVMKELKNFVSSPILSREGADANIKRCISVLANKPEEIIARCIVAIVLENIDEEVEIFERPAPPLTKTQHRLIVLLSVFRTLDLGSDKITPMILSKISEKLLPDKFFWPDDSVESACRFYTALCRGRNDTKTVWKFCIESMTEMKQRSCLIIFTALKTWPDILHDASTMQNNMLAVTIVNIFLQTPKEDGLRNTNQKKKLMALKHLLTNFYQFKVNDTIEMHTKKVWDSVLKDEAGSYKSLVLLFKCREWNWSSKHILTRLKTSLTEWFEGEISESVGSKLLSVMKQICSVFSHHDLQKGAVAEVKEVISCLSAILVSRKKSHSSEEHIVEILLEMKQFSEVRKIIREWIPKNAISESLRNEIVNVSAENILRELKLNRKKDNNHGKFKNKKTSKKFKGKKKKGKNRKNSVKSEKERQRLMQG